VLIVLKFLAAVSPWRKREMRIHDIGDISLVYKSGGDELDRPLMLKLSEQVYPGASTNFRSCSARSTATSRSRSERQAPDPSWRGIERR
jgi:hypothetical protein